MIEGSECEDKLDGIYLLSDQGSIANLTKTRVFTIKINHSRSNISSQKHHFFQQKGLKKLHLRLMLAGLMSSIIVKKLFFSQGIADSKDEKLEELLKTSCGLLWRSWIEELKLKTLNSGF